MPPGWGWAGQAWAGRGITPRLRGSARRGPSDEDADAMSDLTTRHATPHLLPTLLPLLESAAQEEGLEAHALLEDALRARASDIHLDPHQESLRVRLRIDGRVIEALRLDVATGARLTNQFKVLARLNPVPSLAAAEGCFSWPPGEEGSEETFLRVTAVSCVAGEKMAWRRRIPSGTSSPWGSESRALGAC